MRINSLVIDDLCKEERLITLSKTNEYDNIIYFFFYDEILIDIQNMKIKEI